MGFNTTSYVYCSFYAMPSLALLLALPLPFTYSRPPSHLPSLIPSLLPPLISTRPSFTPLPFEFLPLPSFLFSVIQSFLHVSTPLSSSQLIYFQKMPKAGEKALQEVRPRNMKNCLQCQGQRIKVSALNALYCGMLTRRCACSVILVPHSAQTSARAVRNGKVCVNLTQSGRIRPNRITKVLVRCVIALYMNAPLACLC